jgi:hypothetical protein
LIAARCSSLRQEVEETCIVIIIPIEEVSQPASKAITLNRQTGPVFDPLQCKSTPGC